MTKPNDEQQTGDDQQSTDGIQRKRPIKRPPIDDSDPRFSKHHGHVSSDGRRWDF